MSNPNTDILVDARRQGWFWMEDDVIDKYGRALGAIGVAIYAYLARRSDPRGVSFPSYGTIARDLNLGRRTVINHIRKLEQLGLIIVHRRNGQGRASNVYQLVNIRGREPDPASPAAAGAPPQEETSDTQQVYALPIAALTPSTGAPDALVQEMRQSGSPNTGVSVALVQEMHQLGGPNTGVADTPVQELHHPGATGAPLPVQEMHPTGAAAAPEGNTVKETQRKETQMKEKKTRPSRATEAVGPDDPSLHSTEKNSSFGFLALENPERPKQESPAANGKSGKPAALAETAPEAEPVQDEADVLTEMLDALARVTGKNLAFLRPGKREEFQNAAQKLLDYDFSPADVRDFGRYWREGHPIGSNKLNAGRPHLSQVLEDLPASREWLEQKRQEETDNEDDYPTLIILGDEPVEPFPEHVPQSQPLPAAVLSQQEPAEAKKIWRQLHEQLRMSLFGNPLLRALDRARPLAFHNGRLSVLMPDDASADVWRMRMSIPVERAAIRAFSQPLSVLFLGPTEAAMFAQ